MITIALIVLAAIGSACVGAFTGAWLAERKLGSYLNNARAYSHRANTAAVRIEGAVEALEALDVDGFVQVARTADRRTSEVMARMDALEVAVAGNFGISLRGARSGATEDDWQAEGVAT